MELLKIIKETLKSVERHQQLLDECKLKLLDLRKCYQPTNKELYSKIEDFFTYKVINRKYIYILGGDGRSQPWDERRTGEVAEVIIEENVFLSEDQKKVVSTYIKSQNTIDHLEFLKEFTE